MGQSTSTAAISDRRDASLSHRSKPRSTALISSMHDDEAEEPNGSFDGLSDYISDLPDKCLACIFQSKASSSCALLRLIYVNLWSLCLGLESKFELTCSSILQDNI
ncbi:hypothetical protein SLE2022_368800 [Rubroshorea leprosula]